MNVSNVLKAGLTGVFLVGLMSAAPAMADIDVSAATTALSTDGKDALETVGMALIGLAGVAVVFKWAKAAFFG